MASGIETSETIRITGTVQGVGFRPAVYRLARSHGLQGSVRNDEHGVRIEVGGERSEIESFVRELAAHPPPLASISGIERQPGCPTSAEDFVIAPSSDGVPDTQVAADAACCGECLAELSDNSSRRHRYAFTNCTHCGPRLSIIRGIPYDRAHTSMSPFPLCAACEAEFNDPGDRRFHAQATACPACGPELHWWAATGQADAGHGLAPSGNVADPLQLVVEALHGGRIVAIKGLGGFQLACSATDPRAVETLRRRKCRPHKPLALMAADLVMVEQYCEVTEAERALLKSPAAPIVLLRVRSSGRLAPGIAPEMQQLGFMLPCTPLHHLLMADFREPIVLTSGNRASDPPALDNDAAIEELGSIADGWLLHDRAIANRLDDSVVRVVASQPQILRRARGFAPAPVTLPPGFDQAPRVLALGGELKSTFCMLAHGTATLSAHLGDLGGARARDGYGAALDRMTELLRFEPEIVASDCHPGYYTSALADDLAHDMSVPRQTWVQHHHAHVAGCMADNAVPRDGPPVLGLALDGLGHGTDGTLWGCEALCCSYTGYRRLATLAPVALPGGTQAILQPWRMAFSHLCAVGWEDVRRQYGSLALIRSLERRPLDVLRRMMATSTNAPLTSSCGRLFDAVAAALDVCSEVSYEGQAAIALEQLAQAHEDEVGYPFALKLGSAGAALVLDPAPMWSALLEDLSAAVPAGRVAARFHCGLAQALVRIAVELTEQHQDPWCRRVALTGGVMQNSVLAQALVELLEQAGFQVLMHRQVPANDGGLSLGQAIVAAASAIQCADDVTGATICV